MKNHREVQLVILEHLQQQVASILIDQASPAKLATAKGHLATFLDKRMRKLVAQLEKAEGKAE